MPFRNVETHFSKAPAVNIKRSSFKYNLPHKFTMNAGDLVPFMVEEVLPGDTFDLNLSKVVRLSSSIHPTMDNLYLDTYFFFVPNRFCWDHWQNFMGENDKAWTDSTEYVPPILRIGSSTDEISGSLRFGSIAPQSILNYLGIPAFNENEKKAISISLLPFNAYCKVWNDWFRSENLIDEIPIYKNDGYVPRSYTDSYYSFTGGNFGSYVGINNSDSCLKVAKFADYFTRALPQPQKGADVLIPAGGSVEFANNGQTGAFYVSTSNMTEKASGDITASNGLLFGSGSSGALVYDPNGSLSLQGLEITVNNLRLAIQTQKLLERDARSGTRYIEQIRGHFGVVSPDLRLQRSEYLGGKRTLINMSEVIQTSESSSNSPLGNLAGRSLTTGVENGFIKSFTEHGFIIGVCCVRPDRTYSQGIRKIFSRFDRLHYYYPVLANIGEQPIYNKEIFLTNSTESVNPDEVFGYQEAWSEYRTQQGHLSGFMQPGINGTLASWTYADDYSTTPYLSSQWLYQGKNEIDRTLAIPSNTAPQFICDFLVYGKAVRPMPVYSIPGLMDHN